MPWNRDNKLYIRTSIESIVRGGLWFILLKPDIVQAVIYTGSASTGLRRASGLTLRVKMVIQVLIKGLQKLNFKQVGQNSI